MYQDKKRLDVASYALREKELLYFLQKEHVIERVTAIAIGNVYGTTLSPDTPIEALIVSKETMQGAETINKRREELGYASFPTLVCPETKAQDGILISSSRIRAGEIDREGKLYILPSWKSSKELILPESLRPALQKPLGAVFENSLPNLSSLYPNKTVTVGDVITKLCNDAKFGQKISVIDFVVNRKKKYQNITELGFLGDEEIMQVTNNPGTVSGAVFKAVSNLSRNISQSKRIILKIDGEEDLVVLPLLLVLPLGFVILYGQPNVGVVQLIVSEETKNHAKNLVSQFAL